MSKLSVVLALLIVTTCLLMHAPNTRSDGTASQHLAVGLSEQELNEDDALDRFEIDELFLPRLNIELRALFQWSSFESAYLA